MKKTNGDKKLLHKGFSFIAALGLVASLVPGSFIQEIHAANHIITMQKGTIYKTGYETHEKDLKAHFELTSRTTGATKYSITPRDTHISVTSIDTERTGTAGTDMILKGVVHPSNATNQDIKWKVVDAGTTGAYIKDGNVLVTTAAGKVAIEARIEGGGPEPIYPFMSQYNITINPAVSYTATLNVDDLKGASAKLAKASDIKATENVSVTIKADNGKKFSEKPTVTVTGATAGEVTQLSNGDYVCSLKNFTENAVVTVSGEAKVEHISVTSIDKERTGTAGIDMILKGTVHPSNATYQDIKWKVVDAGTTGAYIKDGNVLVTTAAGKVTMEARIEGGGSEPIYPFISQYNITINPAASYTATLNVDDLIGASAKLAKASDIKANENVSVTIKADNGKKFSKKPTVTATGATAGDVTQLSNGDYVCSLKNFTENAVVTVSGEAKAEPQEQYEINVTNDGNGTVSADAVKSEAGKEITLSASPKTGYKFLKWEIVSGTVTIKNNKFVMPKENVSIKAIFEKISTPGPEDQSNPTKPSDTTIKNTSAVKSNENVYVLGFIAIAGISILVKKKMA